MAERRMFSKTIIDSDAFLDMSLSTQALYFHLSMRADDEGFINNPKKIMRMIGASEDDLKVLIMKNFILTFESGVIVIKHWKIHNCIRKDRLVITNYQEERSQLELKDNDSYTFKNNGGIQLVNQMTTTCQPSVNQVSPQYSIGKDSIGKVSIGKVSIDNISAPSSNKDSKLFIELPLIDKSMYPLYEKDVETWKSIYPAVNIEQELRNMFGWLDSNPKNRKTQSGIRRFINNWLSRSQDRAKTTSIPTTTTVIDRDPTDIDQMTDDELLAYINGGGI
jgi:hypothetical protein